VTVRAVPRLAWIAWATVCLVWGTTFLGIKIALETIPPFLMGGLRWTAAGLLLAGLLRAAGRRLPGRRDWRKLAVLGACMQLFGNGGVVWAEQYVPSGLAAVVIGMTPFWMTSVDAALPGGRRLVRRQWVGLAFGLGGIVLLVWPDIAIGGAPGRAFAAGVVSLQLACAGWAVGSAYTRRHVMPDDALGSAAVEMFFGGLLMLVVGTLAGEWHGLAFTVRSAAALAYLTCIGAVVGFAAFCYALQYLDVASVSLYTYVNPIIAVVLGRALLGEPLHARMLAAAGLILAGVWVVQAHARRKVRR
jgi:drug/metabolite transporter (DMT)-like permease